MRKITNSVTKITILPHGGKSEIISFAIYTWPNSPVRAKILSRFQFEGKNDVWISQVRRVKHVYVYIFLSFFSQQFSNYLKLKTIFWNRIGMYATSEIFGLLLLSERSVTDKWAESFTFLGQKRCFEKCLSDVLFKSYLSIFPPIWFPDRNH